MCKPVPQPSAGKFGDGLFKRKPDVQQKTSSTSMSLFPQKHNLNNLSHNPFLNKQEVADYTAEVLADELDDIDDIPSTKVKVNHETIDQEENFNPRQPQTLGFNNALLGEFQ